MNEKSPGKFLKFLKSQSRIKKLVFLVLAIVIAACAAWYFIFGQKDGSQEIQAQRTAVVEKGDISKVVEASGPIESATRKEVASKVNSAIEEIFFNEGDQVQEGEVMFTLDDTDALLGIEEMKNNIATTEISLNNTMEGVTGLSVTAPFDGLVTGLNVKEGESVSDGGSILTITDTSLLKLVVHFSGSEAQSIKVGQTSVVYIQDLMTSVQGVVAYVSSRPFASAGGGLLYTVEISVKNPGSLLSGETANAEIEMPQGTISSTGSATLEFANSKSIRVDSGGTASTVNVRENQYVSRGDLLVKVENESLTLSLNTSKLKLESLKSQLAIKEEQLSYYTIKAPCSGTILVQEAAPGDNVSQGSQIAVVADMTDLQFEVSIDELDIAYLKAGQKVEITADALEDTLKTPLSGSVKKISLEGSSSNGVTTYSVIIGVDSSENLITGMNVNGSINVSSVNDVLLVPLEAVQEMKGGSYVWVKAAGTTGAGTTGVGTTAAATEVRAGETTSSYYSGATLVKVETGANDDTNIEIISGLTEGQIIVLPEAVQTTESSVTTQQGGGMGGITGGLTGGVPAGGVRDGGGNLGQRPSGF